MSLRKFNKFKVLASRLCFKLLNAFKDSSGELHGPTMLVDNTNFGSVIYNHANFYLFEETSTYWLVERISVFLCFSLVNQRHSSSIIVYNLD